MKKMMLTVALFVATFSAVEAQKINLGKAVSAASKGAQALAFSNEDAKKLSKESVEWMDKHNPVTDSKSAYTKRLNRLFGKHKSEDGLDLNYKVYHVVDINAFACADGSVRVFSSLMDIMTDEELLGVIGHEIGHVAHKDSKNAFRTALLTSALKDGVSSTNGKAAALTDSQFGELGEALLNATYSQKQESNADAYGYDFLKKNGKNPWAMALSFEKLKKLEEDSGYQKDSKFKRMFSSHPDLDKRIKVMSERATKDGFARPENKMPEQPVVKKVVKGKKK